MKLFKGVMFLITFLLIFFAINSVFATEVTMSPTYEHEIRYSRGVSNTCYYVDSTAATYTSRINQAANGWVHTYYGDNPIYMTAVSSNRATHMDFYARAMTGDYSSYVAYTNIWTSSGVQLPFNGTTNYYYAEVHINNNQTVTTADMMHEMGHCFGLDEYNNPYSIMWPLTINWYVSTVQACDNATVNYLY